MEGKRRGLRKYFFFFEIRFVAFCTSAKFVFFLLQRTKNFVHSGNSTLDELLFRCFFRGTVSFLPFPLSSSFLSLFPFLKFFFSLLFSNTVSFSLNLSFIDFQQMASSDFDFTFNLVPRKFSLIFRNVFTQRNHK